MNRSTSPQHGQFDWRQMMANLHRPTEPERIAAEIRRLRATGLTEYDIAAALRIGVAAVRQALGQAA